MSQNSHYNSILNFQTLFCGCFFSSWLCCPLRFQNSTQTHWWEGFLVFGNFSSFMTPSLGWVSILNSLVSLFIFYILSYLLSKRMGQVSGLMPSASIQRLFCGICSAFKWSFNEFVGEKVVSSSYSSAILGPLPFLKFWKKNKVKQFPWEICHFKKVTHLLDPEMIF